MVAEYKCSAINVNLKATVGQLGEVGPLVAASSISLGARDKDAWAVGQLESAVSMPAESSEHNEGSAAGDRVMAYLGDHQVCHAPHTVSAVSKCDNRPVSLRLNFSRHRDGLL